MEISYKGKCQTPILEITGRPKHLHFITRTGKRVTEMVCYVLAEVVLEEMRELKISIRTDVNRA